MKSTLFYILSCICHLVITTSSTCQSEPLDVIGRWDIVIDIDGSPAPSWLEIIKSGHETLVGRFVHTSGSARPVSEIKMMDGQFSFSIPRQWEQEGHDMVFEFEAHDNELIGTMVNTDGKSYNWMAKRQPKLVFNMDPEWGSPIELFNRKDLSGWHINENNQWIVEDGILTSPKSGVNLISKQEFMDFKLHAEFRYPVDGNSGIYLRGRYEVQIEDGYGHEPSNILFGGLYGFLTPKEMAAKPAGEWQTYDITLIGNRVTIVANGKAIITDQSIPGITGGAINSHEGEPGSFFLQGDHGPVEFRKFVVTPAK